ncbi:MAG: serine/threonine protein kinase [Myxococcales bacterium]|nr:serine/threonine protein kinase [Myxococcales bacterium]
MGERSGSDDTIAAESRGAERPSARAVLERGAAIGRHTILSRLGAGGMGVVYAAYDPELDRKVALKLLHADAPGGDSDDARRRLQREAQALARLSHPNVVAVHDVLEHDGRVVLAMEFVEGETLTAWRESAARSWRDILDVFVAAGRGLIAAHDRGLVHRDFKPDNVMITAPAMRGEQRVRVMDFGLARPAVEGANADVPPEVPEAPVDMRRSPSALDSPLTRVGAFVGTPAYMAPEQLAGRDVGPAADQFAFCVALWEMLYGERPFRGDGLPALVRAITVGDRSAPPAGVGIPRWLHRACERGMATQPEQRFADMRALVATLEGGQRRKRLRVTAIGLAAIAALGLGVAVYRQHVRAEAEAMCERSGATIAEVWNDDVRAAVHDGLLQSGAWAAETTVQKVTPWLDAHARAWQDARTGACRAHAVEKRWDDEVLDRATWCLDERRLELQALVTRLADADTEAANRAVQAAAGLARIDPCLDDATLRRRSPPPPDARDQIPGIHAEFARADALWATGAHAEGLAVAHATLARAQELGWPRLVASARRRVGSLLVDTGAFAEAETMTQAAYFEAMRAGEVDEALWAADALSRLVGTSLARPDDGLLWAEHAEVLRAEVPDPLGLEAASGLTNVGRIEFARGDYEQARIAFEGALERLEHGLGPEHPNIASALDSLGLARFRRGDYVGAKADFQRGLTIVETTKGREHRDVVPSLNNLALVEVRTAAYAEALAHFERALAVQTAAFGPTHAKVATVVSNMGVVRHLLGEYEAAAALHERALEIREVALGSEHPDVAVSLVNLGLAHFMMGHDDDAKGLFERALAIKSRTQGPDHPETLEALVHLASVLQRRGDHDAASPMFERALPILERTLGAQHRDLSYALVGLARAAIHRGRAAEAVTYAERALELREQGDASAADLATARVVLARALTLVDPHSARGEGLADQACASYRGTGGATPAYLAECEGFAR